MVTLSACLVCSNPITLDFPLAECIQSVLPIADEIILINGDQFNLRNAVRDKGWCIDSEVERVLYAAVNGQDQYSGYNGKLKICYLPWQEHMRKNMDGIGKTAAISQATKDYVLLLDADEAIHEKDFKKIKYCLNKGEDAYSFRTLHFYGDYKHCHNYHGEWYNHRPKLFKNFQGTWDAHQTWLDNGKLKSEYTADLITWDYKPLHSFSKKTTIEMFHYGWVRSNKKMLIKQNAIEKRYHLDWKNMDKWTYAMKDTFKFEGTHPKVMAERIKEFKKE